jgi:23S rRNA (guanine745-N1)-methyltransferase
MNSWSAIAAVLQCPLCQENGEFRGRSFVCRSGHCFDLAASGYLNFQPPQSSSTYDRELFAHRRYVYAQGLYQPLLAELGEIISRLQPELGYKPCHGEERSDEAIQSPVAGDMILDAGCGEGYFAAALASRYPASKILALDISKTAVQMAAFKDSPVYWLVGDIGKLPLATASLDVVLNILTPANYAEFSRVLKPGAHVVKVIPGEQYLQEIRALTGLDAYRDTSARELFYSHYMEAIETELLYRQPLTPDQAEAVLQMTPLTRHVEFSGFDPSQLPEVTIHLHILNGQT